MPAAGVTSDLYVKDENDQRVNISTPPAPPTPTAAAPVTVQNPVTVKAPMADQKPDGSIRDTSTEALRQGNDLGFREFDPDPKPKGEEPPKQEAKPP